MTVIWHHKWLKWLFICQCYTECLRHWSDWKKREIRIDASCIFNGHTLFVIYSVAAVLQEVSRPQDYVFYCFTSVFMTVVLFTYLGSCSLTVIKKRLFSSGDGRVVMFDPSGSGSWKSSKHQLSDRLQVCSIHPQRELLLPDPTGPQQSLLPGTHTRAFCTFTVMRILTEVTHPLNSPYKEGPDKMFEFRRDYNRVVVEYKHEL